MKENGNLFITDQRMLDLMEFCVANKVDGISSTKEWCDVIRISPTNIDNIKKGVRGFSKEHLQAAGSAFKVSMDYLFGFSTEMFRAKKMSSLAMLKAAVKAVDTEFGTVSGSMKKSTKTKK